MIKVDYQSQQHQAVRQLKLTPKEYDADYSGYKQVQNNMDQSATTHYHLRITVCSRSLKALDFNPHNTVIVF